MGENLQIEYEMLNILSNNVKLLEIVKKKHRKHLAKHLERWLDDKNHPIWTENFNEYLEKFLNDIRGDKLRRILKGC